MKPKNNVCAVVVTYNRIDMLKDAINALKNQDYPCDILVVNNGSTDGTKEYLENAEGITVIHQENVGGAGGFHAGLKIACESGYEFAWVMDDDVIPAKDALSNIVNDYKYLSEYEKVGFICSHVLSEKGLSANVPFIEMKSNDTGYPDWSKYLEKGIIRVKTATFVSVFIPCKIIYELGLPYKEYFIWGDDTEYTQRISSKYNCFMSSNSKIIHRRIGGNLDIRKIDDPNRIKMFRKFVRNNYHNHILYESKKKKFDYIKDFSIIAISELLKGNITKTKSILLGFIDAFKFNPKIKYPSIN